MLLGVSDISCVISVSVIFAQIFEYRHASGAIYDCISLMIYVWIKQTNNKQINV